MRDKLKIGCHLSASGGYLSMGKEAVAMGADTFAFFTRNPRGGAAKEINQDDVDAFLVLAAENGISQLVAHSPYTLNPCSSNEHTRQFALETMKDDLLRMEYTPVNLYNFHPGSHTGQGTETGIEEIAFLLNTVITDEQTTTVLLETMAGKGSEVGGTFEEIAEIISRVDKKNKVGVCLDTCHIWDAGYDIVNDLDGVRNHFDNIIGLVKLRAIHLNDSKNKLGSHKDRHEKIVKGKIGKEAIQRIINHPELKDKVFILETPAKVLDDFEKEIALVKSLLD